MQLTTTESRVGRSSRFVGMTTMSSGWASVLVIGVMVAIFDLDRQTGAAPVQHLYYLPTILAGVRFRWLGGLVTALLAIVLYHLANPHLLTFQYGEADLVQIILFVGVGVTAARVADDARRLHHLAMTDDLTGLHNLRSFESRLQAMLRTARRTGTPLALFALDVDRLKQLNDQHGHLTGADAVRSVGHIIAMRIPPEAVGCRYGGDEFVIAAPGCTPAQAHRLAEDLRGAVHVASPVLAGQPFPGGTLSVSIGVSCWPFDRPRLPISSVGDDRALGEALFRAADAALYTAKAAGRNRVSVA